MRWTRQGTELRRETVHPDEPEAAQEPAASGLQDPDAPRVLPDGTLFLGYGVPLLNGMPGFFRVRKPADGHATRTRGHW